MMKTWWIALLFACAREQTPAPVATAPVAPVAQPVVDHEEAPAEAAVGGGTMSNRRPTADLGAQLADVQGGGKTVTAGGGTASPMAADPRKPGRISMLEKQAFDNTTLTADLVAAKLVAAYIAGIRRCYRAYLARDPSAHGELVLRLTVNTSGRAVDTIAKGVSADVGDCVTAQMASWRFPIPKDGNGDAVIAAFQIKLGLAPE